MGMAHMTEVLKCYPQHTDTWDLAIQFLPFTQVCTDFLGFYLAKEFIIIWPPALFFRTAS